MLDGGFEGDGSGYLLPCGSIGCEAVRTEAATPLSGAAHTGKYGMDLGVAGHVPFAGSAILSRVLAFPVAPVPASEFRSFSYWYSAPQGVGTYSPDTFLHHYLFLDMNGDGAWDGCLYGKRPKKIAAAAQWILERFGADALYENGQCTNPADAAFTAIPASGESFAIIAARPDFQASRLTQVMVRAYATGISAPWPAATPIYVDDLSLSRLGAAARAP